MVDTIVAPSTAPGRAALAIVRSSGPLCEKIYGDVFAKAPPVRAICCRPYETLSGEVADLVTVTFFRGPHSFTGEDVMEICCHGNQLIVERIISDMLLRGCRMAGPGEFTRRAFVGGKMDLAQAEAVCELIVGESSASLRIAGRQLAGELGRLLGAVREELLQIISEIEYALDFSDWDSVEPQWPAIRRKLLELRRRMEGLAESYGLRMRAENATAVAIVGSPNAGKSSIFNFLLGRERSIVSPMAGTTRDYVDGVVEIGNLPVRLIDTAGIGDGGTELDRIAIGRSADVIGEAEIILLVVDGADRTAVPFGDQLAAKTGAIVVNKRDLPNFCETVDAAIGVPPWPTISLSTKIYEDGLRLRQFLASFLGANGPGANGDVLCVNLRQRELLNGAIAHIVGAEKLMDGMEGCPAGECVAVELQGANRALGEIVGEDVSQAALDRIFSTFCVGK
ncbi:MAG: tRNA uridine-5-carboxymethylaminomethyl(34) synthesis GTPase MnmE [Puniceicoccales bacterium]|jgi:tRNA modification GTPase|nr:tRNA uridine-5-carboxymethylaminomethyl(34) synthesis GTPase MnmE [Puniceicoccales bacterium]